MNSTQFKLAIAAVRMIAIGLAILTLLIAVGILNLSVATVKAIALGIKLLNKWCDEQSITPKIIHLSGSNAIAMLPAAHPRTLITPAVLPSSGKLIAIAPPVKKEPVAKLAQTLFNSAPKKRGRPKKIA